MAGGFSDSANCRETTAVEVLEAIVTKIRDNITALDSETTCFVTDCPIPSIEVNDHVFCTVCPSDGNFDQPDIDGGGNLQVVENMAVHVTVFSRIETDQLEHYHEGLVAADRGLLVLKRAVLKALAGKNLDGGIYAQTNQPAALLIEALYPSRATHPSHRQLEEYGQFSLSFEAKFLWGLNDGEGSEYT